MNRLWLGAALALLVGCTGRNEVSRVPSPDGALDAVVLESDSGGTSSSDYSVYVVKRGATLGRYPVVMSFDAALRGNSPHAVTLKWSDSSNLAVEYLSARKVTLPSGDIHLEDRHVRITPRPGVSDPSPTLAETR